MRIGSVDDIQVLPQNDKNTTSEETIVEVTLIAGDTGNHQPLLDRAGKNHPSLTCPKLLVAQV